MARPKKNAIVEEVVSVPAEEKKTARRGRPKKVAEPVVEETVAKAETPVAVEEKNFPIFSVIGGCSPAYTYMYIDSLARAGVKNGLPKKMALEIAAQAVLGSAKTILESEEHPWELIDRVCSPGGTTIEGVASLQNDGFEATVIKAVEESYKKDSKV